MYEKKNGESQIIEWINTLNTTNSKDNLMNLKKFYYYVEILKEKGTRAGTPYVKSIDGDIWELRPIDNRIFFFVAHKNTIVLLHQFTKKSNKTPKNEIERAIKEKKDWLDRNL